MRFHFDGEPVAVKQKVLKESCSKTANVPVRLSLSGSVENTAKIIIFLL